MLRDPFQLIITRFPRIGKDRKRSSLIFFKETTNSEIDENFGKRTDLWLLMK